MGSRTNKNSSRSLLMSSTALLNKKWAGSRMYTSNSMFWWMSRSELWSTFKAQEGVSQSRLVGSRTFTNSSRSSSMSSTAQLNIYLQEEGVL